MTGDLSGEIPRHREDISDRSIKTWQEVVKKQQEGRSLTETESSALDIRRVCLTVADAINQMTDNPQVLQDTVMQAELLSDYHQGVAQLKELGIEENMHVGNGDPESFYIDPQKFHPLSVI